MNLNINARELYEIWKNRNVSTPDYNQTYVDKWNAYKTDYISALNSGSYTKGSFVVISDSDIMNNVSQGDNRSGYTEYSDYIFYCLRNDFNNAGGLGNTLTSTNTPIISDPEITVTWSDVTAS